MQVKERGLGRLAITEDGKQPRSLHVINGLIPSDLSDQVTLKGLVYVIPRSAIRGDPRIRTLVYNEGLPDKVPVVFFSLNGESVL